MEEIQAKSTLPKCSSSPAIASKESSRSTQIESTSKSKSCNNQLNGCAPFEAPASCHPTPTTAPANEATRNTQFETDFIATIQGLYKDVSCLTIPSTKKYDKVSERVEQDAAFFFEDYAKENLQEAYRLLEEGQEVKDSEKEFSHLTGKEHQGVETGTHRRLSYQKHTTAGQAQDLAVPGKRDTCLIE
jgi:hypothetical protein